MAAGYSVKFDLSDLFGQYSALADQLFPLISQAVEATTAEGAYKWKDEVNKASIWSGDKAQYLDSIKWRMVTDYEGEITTDFPGADNIENGQPARDLKRMLQTSKKTRMVEHGKHAGQKYLIIPFRHNIPTSSGEGALADQMPSDIYAKAKQLKASMLMAPGTKKPATRLSASGHTVPQHSYAWGGRLPAGLAAKKSEHHVTDIYAGMVKMKTSTPGAKSSAYMTFRVMGEWSSGWVTRPKPGMNLAGRVSDDLQRSLEENIGKAVTLGMLRR